MYMVEQHDFFFQTLSLMIKRIARAEINVPTIEKPVLHHYYNFEAKSH